MSSFKNMKIGTRLGLAFAVVITTGLVVAAYGRVALQLVGEELRLITDDRLVKLSQVRDIKDNLNEIALSARNIALLTDEREMQAEKKDIESRRALNSDLIRKLEESIVAEQGRALLSQVAHTRQPYNIALDKAVALGLANRTEEARDALLKEVTPLQANYFKALDGLIDFQEGLAKASKKEARDHIDTASLLMLLFAVLAGIAGTTAAWLVARSITAPVRSAVQSARRIAEGDLSQPVQVTRGDEIGELLGAMRDMQTALARTVASVRDNAESVATGSTQIAQGNADLSRRTEQQASALQQTAATMTQLGTTVKHNADNALQADRLAKGAREVARQGGAVVGEVVETMKGINDSSHRIAEIIGTIDGIAFQTNILALNAAVEAARAGEQGRGFAVVAGEVRTLAQRSAEAAREIKSLIGVSVERVAQGSALVDRAGVTMTEVVDSIRRVSDIVGEIAGASTEQAGGVAQVGQAVTQMDQMTQQNSALVEESAAAADSLKTQAQAMVQAVAVFRLAQDPPVRAV
jgi:methyl-accepting chemotaxis protein